MWWLFLIVNLCKTLNKMKSNLTIEQQKLVRTPAFKKWFGDWENSPQTASKVVDENGEPLVVYNRSKKTFFVFDADKQLNGWLGKGFYFSESKFEFKDYGNKLLSVFLNIRNPFVVKGQEPTDFLYELKKKFNADTFDTTEKLKENSYDGVIYKHWDYDGKMFSCFEPNQIKLADGNNTTFDIKTNDVRFEGGGEIKSKGSFKPLGSAKELGVTPKIEGHDMIAICDCGEKFSYQNSKKDILWQCPECNGMKRIKTS